MGECRNTAIVLAAGQGKRMHSKIQKQFMELDGMPVLCYSLRCFQESPLIRDVILVTGDEYVFWCKEEIVEKYGFTKISAVVSGGKERYDSVYEGLRACKDTEYVLIHDGARPFIDHGIIERGLMAAAQTGASVTGMLPRIQLRSQMRMGMSVKLRIAAVYGSSRLRRSFSTH